MPLDSNTRDVALDILDRALHPGTSDEEVVASIYAWRRKTGNALIRDVAAGQSKRGPGTSRRRDCLAVDSAERC